MRKIITVLVLLFITVSTFAQQGINYKAIIKDDSGNVMANTSMNIQFTIHENTATGTIVYQESHNFTTDANGLVILTVGTSALISVGTFSAIDWAADVHFLQVTISYSGGIIDFDATQFMAVPYALNVSENINDLSDGKSRGRSLYIGDGAGLNDDAFITGPVLTFTNNVGIGHYALNKNTSGSYNTAIGLDALFGNITGFSNVAVGSGALEANTSGQRNTAVGRNSMRVNSIGQSNTAIGYRSLSANTEGDNNTALGNFSLNDNTTGNFNTAIGIEALSNNTTGYSNIGIGLGALIDNETGNLNIAIGQYSGINNSSGSGNIYIGNGSGSSTAAGSNKLYINNTQSDMPLIYGEFDTDLVRINGTFNVTQDMSVDGTLDVTEIINNETINTQTINTEEINTSTTGTANLIPIAYGIVESTGSVLSGTGNFTAFLSGNVFIIDVNGTESLSYGDTVAIITPISTTARSSTTIIADGNGDSDADLNVRIFTASGTQVTTTFQFVIYKL
ncbi:hypothetical protein [Kordia sp.]|uniref:hypothetical protein n=1 Tax=Kordia sp. TaxID=1965332 RepID=UPI003D6C0553